MGSRLNPTSNMYIPMNGPPRGAYYPIAPSMNQQIHQPIYPGSFQYQPGFPHLPPQQQQQAQLAQLHNQQLHNQLAQQQQQQAQIAQQQQQQQHALLQQSSQIQHIQLPQSNISNSNTNNQNNNQNNNIKEPNIPKTNTQYTNFEIKNLELASRYFSECSTKDFLGSNKKKISSIAWNANGTKLAASTYDGITRIWNFDPSGSNSSGSGSSNSNSSSNRNNSNSSSSSSSNSGIKEIELKGHEGAIEKICWHPKNSDILATAGVDKFIRIWDTRSGKSTASINTLGENIDVQWHHDGSFIISCTKEDHIALIDASTNKLLKNFKFTGEEINQVAWDTCGELLFQANSIGNIEVYKFQPKSGTQLKHLKTLFGHTHSANCIDFDPTGKYFAVGSGDSIVSLWDIEEMMCIRSFTKLAFPCKSVSFSSDGQFIASASNESNLDISHVESGQSIHTIESPGAQSIKWHPTLPYLAYAELSETSKDCVVRVFGYHN